MHPDIRLSNSIDMIKQIHFIHKPSTNMIKYPRRNQNRSSATAIATENTATDDSNTPVFTDTPSEIESSETIRRSKLDH